MTKSLYDKLGVDRNCSAEEIRAAYKDKVKKCHPDKGGDSAEFQEVNKAYVTLYDPVKRKRYDDTGQSEDVPFERKFGDLVNNIFMRLVEMENERKANLVAMFKKQ